MRLPLSLRFCPMSFNASHAADSPQQQHQQSSCSPTTTPAGCSSVFEVYSTKSANSSYEVNTSLSQRHLCYIACLDGNSCRSFDSLTCDESDNHSGVASPEARPELLLIVPAKPYLVTRSALNDASASKDSLDQENLIDCST